MGSDAPKRKNNNDKSMLLALLLFLGAAALIFTYFGSPVKGQGDLGRAAPVRSQEMESSVNKHLKFTHDVIEFQKQRVEVENAQSISGDRGSARHSGGYVNENKLDMSLEDHSAEVAKDLGRIKRSETLTTPDDLIQRDVYNAQMAAEYSQAYREEYARQFVENARRGGYRVILSEDLSRVLSVTPLRKPSKESFEVFGSGGQPVQ